LYCTRIIDGKKLYLKKSGITTLPFKTDLFTITVLELGSPPSPPPSIHSSDLFAERFWSVAFSCRNSQANFLLFKDDY
jgi:hypothetical protein